MKILMPQRGELKKQLVKLTCCDRENLYREILDLAGKPVTSEDVVRAINILLGRDFCWAHIEEFIASLTPHSNVRQDIRNGTRLAWALV